MVSCLLAGVARADLVWSPGTGWKIEGGILSGLTGAEGRDALILMNKARQAEEVRHYHTALKAYERVVKNFPNSVYAPEAYYHTGKIWLARGRYYKAFDSYQQILSRYPNTKRFNELIEAQYRIASALLDGARNTLWFGIKGFTNREVSVGCFEIILANAPYSDYAPLVLMNPPAATSTWAISTRRSTHSTASSTTTPRASSPRMPTCAWQSCTPRLSRAPPTTRRRRSRPSPTTRTS